MFTKVGRYIIQKFISIEAYDLLGEMGLCSKIETKAILIFSSGGLTSSMLQEQKASARVKRIKIFTPVLESVGNTST